MSKVRTRLRPPAREARAASNRLTLRSTVSRSRRRRSTWWKEGAESSGSSMGYVPPNTSGRVERSRAARRAQFSTVSPTTAPRRGLQRAGTAARRRSSATCAGEVPSSSSSGRGSFRSFGAGSGRRRRRRPAGGPADCPHNTR